MGRKAALLFEIPDGVLAKGVNISNLKEIRRRGLGLNLLKALNNPELSPERRDEILRQLTELETESGNRIFGTD